MSGYRIYTFIVLSFSMSLNFSEALPAISTISPDGNVFIEFTLQNTGQLNDVPHYRVKFKGIEVLSYSQLGVALQNNNILGGPSEIVSIDSQTIHESYKQVTGKRFEITNYASQNKIVLKQKETPFRKWEVEFRAYNDGVAFRYRFPKQDGWDSLAINNELTSFQFQSSAIAYALPLNGFTTSYETRYVVEKVKDLSPDSLFGLPLLLNCPGGIWAAVTEANINEYAGMYLSSTGEGILSAKLSYLPNEPNVAVRHTLPHVSPWRIIMLGERIGSLVESDIVLNLSEPCAIEDTSWIHSGKTTFPWWNGFYEENVEFKPGLNTETAKYYIDFCAEAGIPYHSLDGVENSAWYGGPIVPYEGAEPTKGIDGLDLQKVLNYAKSKNVRIRLWMNWKAAEAYMDKAFPLYHEWGIEGVMLDFMDRDDQEMYRFVRRAVKLAADNKLTVTLHGCPKPTGLERTYPNLLTHEGVMNLEYNKWDAVGITSEHETIVPFTRMLAGPLDFHQGSFRTVQSESFKPQNDAPFVIGTPARTLASYVIYQNHLSMVADYPSAYRGHPALPVLAEIPTTWDDTIVLDAEVGKYVVIARKSGSDWHIGAMTNSSSRTLRLSLQFLEQGQYLANQWIDDISAKHGITNIIDDNKTPLGELELQLHSSGGAYVRLTPKN